MIKDDLRSFRRSWVHHTGTQLATLTVLTATFAVVGFVLSLSLNLKRVIAAWGQEVQLTVYLGEDVTDERVQQLKSQIEKWADVAGVNYIPREVATEHFKAEMATYAPSLLSDNDFANPFPSSFRVKLKGSFQGAGDVVQLERLSARLGKLPGIEDVSYGQSWVKNYSAFLNTINAMGGVFSLILLAGALFVVGNAIRASIAARRDEIAILELVGATSAMIRRPYMTEGFFMGLLAGAFALLLNFTFHVWQMHALASSAVLARLSNVFVFLTFPTIIIFIMGGALLGALGAWFTVSGINDGWAATQRSFGS